MCSSSPFPYGGRAGQTTATAFAALVYMGSKVNMMVGNCGNCTIGKKEKTKQRVPPPVSASPAPPSSPPPLSGSRSEQCEVSMEPEQSHLEWGMCSGSSRCSAVRAPIVWQRRRRRGQARAVRCCALLLFLCPFFLHPCSAE